jgi:hypothetical protein
VSTAGLGVASSAIAAQLADWPRRRVELSELKGMLRRAEPSVTHAPEFRARLADILGELAAAQVVELPSQRSFDRSARPPLPRFVRVGRPTQSPRRIAARDYAWRSDLAWAAELTFDEQTLSDLRAVNAFLRDGGAQRPVVPMRERSLQLFEDEKRLDALLATQLFWPGRLTLAQLRCEAVHPPFVYQHLGAGLDALVVENHHTYVSLARALPSEGSVGIVIYGAGTHFKGSVTYLADLERAPTRVLYFGDIDPDGLHIPASASELSVARGLPEIQPAVGLYRLLVTHGHPTVNQAAGRRWRVERLVDWLPAELRAPATSVLTADRRLAQEWVGTELLAGHAAVLKAL